MSEPPDPARAAKAAAIVGKVAIPDDSEPVTAGEGLQV
jgi:hypothetical protein